jgi:hypothetical protein
MARRRTNEEILAEGGLDPYQEDYLRAELEKLKAKGPPKPPEVQPEEPGAVSEGLGWIGQKLKGAYDYWTASPYRALEAPASVLKTVAWPATKAFELFGTEDMAAAGRKVQAKLDEKRRKYAALAGGYDPEQQWPAELVGTLKWPFPAVKPAGTIAGSVAKNALPGAVVGGAYGAAAQTDLPEEQRDYVTGTAIGAGLGGVGQAALGRLAGRGTTPKPTAENLGVAMPSTQPSPGPAVKQLPKQRPLRQQIEDRPPVVEEPPVYDAEFTEVHPEQFEPPIQRPLLEHQPPQSPPIFAKGPVRTGEGTVIEMPGPTYRQPPHVEDIVARERFQRLEPIARPEPLKREIPTELNIQQRPPVLTKSSRPVEKPEVPFADRPQDVEIPRFIQEREQPITRTVQNPTQVPRETIITQPRHELPPELNQDMADRVQFARDTMEIAGQERGFRAHGEAIGQGSTEEILGSSKSPTAQWYQEVTTGGGKLKPAEVEKAIAKIEQDAGVDKGKQVERVKDALLRDPEFRDWRRAYGAKDPVDEFEAEFALAPEEPVIPEDFLPLQETQLPEFPEQVNIENPFAQKKSTVEGDDWFMNTPAQTEIPVPPPTIGERPIIGREVNPLTAETEAPLFSKSAQTPKPEQPSMFHEVEPQSTKEIAQEFHVEQENLGSVWDNLNNERGSVKLGKGITMVQRGLSQRRMAERHPEFRPIYDTATYRGEFASTVKHDLRTTAENYFKLGKADRAAVDKYLRARPGQQTTVGLVDRETGKPLAPLTSEQQTAVRAIDQTMASAMDLINDVRQVHGLPPMQTDPYYVPFARSGDYLTILDGPNNLRWVSASQTLREAEALEKQLQAKFPGSKTVVKASAGKKGDEPALDFGTLSLLEKAGLLTPQEYEQAINQFNLPPGFSEHFRHAMKIMGESTDLSSPIERYIDALGNYTSKFLYDDVMKNQIAGLKDPQMRQYAERYRDYLNEKPAEWSRLRGGVAVWDLMVNVGSMVQNASQVPTMGIPNLQRAVGGIKPAMKIFKDAWGSVLNPTKQDRLILEMAEREGHVRPINAQELFGTQVKEPNSLELGSPYVQRLVDRGVLSQGTASAVRKPIDLAAKGLSGAADKFSELNKGLGEKVSYAFHRLTGNTVQMSEEQARKAQPFLMQGFSAIEEMNRKWAILAGYRAGIQQGKTPAEAFEFAKQFSRDVNFDYSPISRPELFRGKKAIIGLFGTYPVEALSTYSKMAREAVKGKIGPFSTAMAAFWTMAGLKGIPFMEDVDTYGPSPGMFSENIPEWMYHGPVSAATGLDVASKYKMRIPVVSDIPNVAHGEFDLGTMPALQPFVQGKRTADWFMQSPRDLPSMQVAAERLLPPSLRSLAAAGRWAGFGPAGKIERGAVGTIKGHTPGPTEEGKKDFFYPSGKDIAGKALTFTPLELSKQYQRGRIAAVETDRGKGDTSRLVQAAANDLDRGIQSKALQELATKSPRTYQNLMKAYNRRQGVGHGSTFELYRKSQEPKPPKPAATVGR